MTAIRSQVECLERAVVYMDAVTGPVNSRVSRVITNRLRLLR